MSQDAPLHKLAPAGYLILQDAAQARRTDEYQRDFGPYFGVDRLPLLFPPDAAIRQILDEPPVQDARLQAVLEDWFDSRYRNTAFLPARSRALRLLKGFKACGFPFDLVYCQVAWKQGDEARLSEYAKTNEGPPAVSLTYGFDVSWPSCNHSAILQPGVVPSSPRWREKLNHYGLLNDYRDAADLRDEYLAVYPYPPFDIYEVHRVAED